MAEQEEDPRKGFLGRRAAAIGVHVFTATGAALGLLALERAVAKDFPTMFGWLALALFVDGVDGTLARMARVRENAPWFDGDVLDLVVDFLTYVIVPAAALWQAGFMQPIPGAIALLVLVTCSALYFADRRMKTVDHWFRGFPALWNVLILYIFAFQLPGWLVFAVLLAFTALMFAPIVFVHPMRVAQMRVFTSAIGALWCVCAALVIFDDLKGPWFARLGLLATAAYFVVLPFLRRPPGQGGAERLRSY